MKNLLIILSLLLLSDVTFCGKIVFGGKNRDKAYSLIVRNEHNIQIAGITRSYGGWFDQAYFANLTYADSAVLCEKAFFANAAFYNALPITLSKTMAFGKTQLSTPVANFQCMAAIFSENCDTLCTFLSGGDGDDGFLCGTIYKSCAYLGGYVQLERTTVPFITKLDSTGNEIFAHAYANFNADSIVKIATNNVDIWAIAVAETNFLFAKLNDTGELSARFSVKRASGDFIRGMFVADDGVIVCGARGCNSDFLEYDLCLGEAFVEKFDFAGNVLARATPCNFEGCVEEVVQFSPDSIFAIGFAAHKDSVENVTLDSYGAVFSGALHVVHQATADLHAFENIKRVAIFGNQVYVAGEFSKDPCCHWDIFVAPFSSIFP